jgi:hypothetical protein
MSLHFNPEWAKVIAVEDINKDYSIARRNGEHSPRNAVFR